MARHIGKFLRPSYSCKTTAEIFVCIYILLAWSLHACVTGMEVFGYWNISTVTAFPCNGKRACSRGMLTAPPEIVSLHIYLSHRWKLAWQPGHLSLKRVSSSWQPCGMSKWLGYAWKLAQIREWIQKEIAILGQLQVGPRLLQRRSTLFIPSAINYTRKTWPCPGKQHQHSGLMLRVKMSPKVPE